jgi:hypothetical protein
MSTGISSNKYEVLVILYFNWGTGFSQIDLLEEPFG